MGYTEPFFQCTNSRCEWAGRIESHTRCRFGPEHCPECGRKSLFPTVLKDGKPGVFCVCDAEVAEPFTIPAFFTRLPDGDPEHLIEQLLEETRRWMKWLNLKSEKCCFTNEQIAGLTFSAKDEADDPRVFMVLPDQRILGWFMDVQMAGQIRREIRGPIFSEEGEDG